MKKFAVIGNPIDHSLSPALHMEIYNQLNFKAKYYLEKISSNELDFFINNNNYDGVNITIPHKENVIKIVKKIDRSAKIIGAINCLKKDNGFNTDWIGFLYSMKVNNVNLKDKNCLILGSGGVARAITYSLSTSNVKGIKIQGRNNIKVKLLQDWINNLYPKNSIFEIPNLIINCTPIGMHPYIEDIPIKINKLNKETILIDTIYNPLETKWLFEGKKIGLKTIGGLDMFIAQGIISAEKWFNKKIFDKLDLQEIRKKLRKKLC
tara:strand:- start:5272 stop:6063 length:792 start_codon:yes stop_codon:yes gene_type:complete